MNSDLYNWYCAICVLTSTIASEQQISYFIIFTGPYPVPFQSSPIITMPIPISLILDAGLANVISAERSATGPMSVQSVL
jgi:hypothetical protein